MSEHINIKLSGPLKEHVKAQVSQAGCYESASEYVMNLIRLDYEKFQEDKWSHLANELTPGLETDENQFKIVTADDVMTRCKKRRICGS